MAKLSKKEARRRRHLRIRKKVSGTADRPRVAVCCTEKHIYIQFIDDERGHTLASVSSLDPEFRKGDDAKANLAGAVVLGKLAGERARAASIQAAVFDRGGFMYHGRVKAVADGVREAGITL